MRNYLLVAKAIGNSTRARILKLLEPGELCVCDVISVIGLKQSTISKQLGLLKNAGLVEDRRDGNWIYYKLAKENINEYNLIFNNLLKKCLNGEEIIKKDKTKLKSIQCCTK